MDLFLRRAVVLSLLGLLAGLKAPAYADEKSGRFQIVVLGWRCVRATHDHAGQVDGKGDEVFIVVRLQGPQENSPTVIRTKTMGDVNDLAGRIKAGSRSDLGGIKDGDQYPAAPFEQREAFAPEDVPLLVWEGELREGQPGVAVELAIWEDDMGGAVAWQQFLNALGSPTAKDALRSLPVYQTRDVQVKVDASGLGELFKTIFGVAKDRPIGKPKGFTFTHGAINELLKSPAANDVPTGVVALTFRDSDVPEYQNNGEYIVWLQVRPVP
jgi:hypothetical protein